MMMTPNLLRRVCNLDVYIFMIIHWTEAAVWERQYKRYIFKLSKWTPPVLWPAVRSSTWQEMNRHRRRGLAERHPTNIWNWQATKWTRATTAWPNQWASMKVTNCVLTLLENVNSNLPDRRTNPWSPQPITALLRASIPETWVCSCSRWLAVSWEHESRGISIIRNRYQTTAIEDITCWGDMVCALICRVCRLAIVLRLFVLVVISNKHSVNLIFNPNPVSTH
jgi:hypothetical protein